MHTTEKSTNAYMKIMGSGWCVTCLVGVGEEYILLPRMERCSPYNLNIETQTQQHKQAFWQTYKEKETCKQQSQQQRFKQVSHKGSTSKKT